MKTLKENQDLKLNAATNQYIDKVNISQNLGQLSAKNAIENYSVLSKLNKSKVKIKQCKESTWIFSNEKGTSRFDETGVDASTTINGTTATNIEASIISDELSPRQNLNYVYQKLPMQKGS